jgi:hypothetical protein
MVSMMNQVMGGEADGLRDLNVRIAIARANLGALEAEREKRLDAAERRILSQPGGEIAFETLLDHATAQRTGASVEDVIEQRRQCDLAFKRRLIEEESEPGRDFWE